jgi:hypothetical protein
MLAVCLQRCSACRPVFVQLRCTCEHAYRLHTCIAELRRVHQVGNVKSHVGAASGPAAMLTRCVDCASGGKAATMSIIVVFQALMRSSVDTPLDASTLCTD